MKQRHGMRWRVGEEDERAMGEGEGGVRVMELEKKKWEEGGVKKNKGIGKREGSKALKTFGD